MKTLLLLVSFFWQTAQQPMVVDSAVQQKTIHPMVEKGGFPVDADSTIFLFKGIGPYSLEERAARVREKLTALENVNLDITPLKVEYNQEVNDILCQDQIILSINDADAQALGLSRRATTEYYKDLLKNALTQEEEGFSNLLFVNIGIALLIIGLFIFGLKYYNRLFRLLAFKLQAQKGKVFKGFKVKQYELLTVEKQLLIAGWLLTVAKYALLLFIIYLLLPALFALFPWTQGLANKLIHYVVDPLVALGHKIVGYIPNLLFIIVIVVILKYFLKLLSFFKKEVATGRLEIKGFYPEWASPTFNIVRAIFIALAFIGIWPLLPMSNSEIFKGVSTFFGLLVALGGAGAFSNIIAGLVITYMRSFKIGDRVKIGEVIGDVKEKALLNTKIKTIKNEIITIPNSQMINSHTINYTTANEEEGLILHTTVTIGYDVPWREVHKLLVEAALATEHIKKKPHPFVLQTSLDDFYVSYQLNARTREIQKMALIYSELHKNIQDKFNEAGVEIMSPHYGAHRDGNQSTIPQSYLPEDYRAPSFRIKTEE
ncbi:MULTISPECIES: mechanosensitive ion channel family protein [Roseivirga]|jgi:small-conductance mechanosensitive channel|nr:MULTISPECIES: mechanosensitive ion channel domain-containing protein [Roseivirga]|tara:strand:- start:87700 stop:89328 length:1629 start_codon:yes stop_codon:yes gene_type:complete